MADDGASTGAAATAVVKQEPEAEPAVSAPAVAVAVVKQEPAPEPEAAAEAVDSDAAMTDAAEDSAPAPEEPKLEPKPEPASEAAPEPAQEPAQEPTDDTAMTDAAQPAQELVPVAPAGDDGAAAAVQPMVVEDEVEKTVEGVVTVAKRVLKETADLSKARSVFESAVFEWTDALSDDDELTADDRFSAESKLVDLWVSYASFERELRQFKQTTKIFESAVADPTVAKFSKLWLEYASFCTARGKLSNARRVYRLGLKSLADSAEEARDGGGDNGEDAAVALVDEAATIADAYVAFAQQHLGDALATRESLQAADAAEAVSTSTAAATEDDEGRAAAVEAPDEAEKAVDHESKRPKLEVSSYETRAADERAAADDDAAFEEFCRENSADEKPRSENFGPGELTLFPRDRVSASEIHTALDAVGLAPAEMMTLVKLMQEPTMLEVVEALRVVSALQFCEVEETWAAVRNDQMRRLRDGSAQRDSTLVQLFHLENVELQRRTDAEFTRLSGDIQRILQRAGVPLFEASTAPELIAKHRAIIRGLLAANAHAHSH
ncbi:hypothetical protein M885DRAFT_511166 [Pelagophyceae sp. CCMP2097]|nr:hypothetical protein M885DRAFT_511166 [Pelagophyceae sp. CCMP2097]